MPRLTSWAHTLELAWADFERTVRQLLKRPTKATAPKAGSRIRADLVHTTRLPLAGDDPFIVRNAFLLAPDRYCPLPLDDVYWTLASPTGVEWELAFIKRSDASAQDVAGSQPIYAAMEDGRVFTFPCASPPVQRLARFIMPALAAGMIGASIWWVFASLDTRFSHEIEELELARLEGIETLVEIQNAPAATPSSMTLLELAQWQERLATVDLGDWQAAGLRVEGSSVILRIVAEHPSGLASPEGALNAIAPVLGVRRAPSGNWLDIYWSSELQP